jgi:hypothetical protein
MGAVPRPPADLSDRIKADIPQFLQAERTRFSGSVAFTMRVAASILMLITTAFITLRLLEPETKQTASVAPAPQVIAQPDAGYETAQATASTTQAPPEEVRLDIAQEIPASAAGGRITASTPAAPQPQVAARERRDEATYGYAPSTPEPAPEPIAVTAEAPAFMQDSVTNEADARDTEKKREFALAPPAAASAPAPAASMRAAGAPASKSLMSEAYASELSLEQKSEVFGISVDPRVFDEMKVALEAGKRPAAASVNVDALVNYFAGPPSRAPRRGGVALEVEASPAPVKAEGDQAVLRFTIDTPRMEIGPRASTPPAAMDARLEVEIDPKAVANFHRIGGTSSIAPESTLLHNLSVTGLYQLELKPHLLASQRVATVRLHYRSITDGKPQSITRVIRGKDLARNWSHASRRHRLASLGAVWSESLRSAAPQADVARRAQELSSQRPEDARARELANAASATAGGKK